MREDPRQARQKPWRDQTERIGLMIRLLLQISLLAGLGALLVLAADRVRNTISMRPDAHATISSAPRRSEGAVKMAEPLQLRSEPLSAYQETLQRPIFFEGRRLPTKAKPAPRPPINRAAVKPAPPARPKPRPRTPLSQLKLQGILVMDGQQRALMDTPDTKNVWYSAGDKVAGWTIDHIAADSITLSQGSHNGQLFLYKSQR